MSNQYKQGLSVVIPAYNAAMSIETAITSAIAAGASRVIVVDDGSLDATAAIAERAGADVLVQKNSGASVARSNGARVVDTTYVTFLDADDELLPEGVSQSIELLDEDENLAVAAGRVLGFVGEGPARLLPQTYTNVTTRSLLVNGYGPWPPGAAVQRTALMRRAESAAPVALRPRFAEDYELLIRMSLVGNIVRHAVPSLKYEMAGGKSAKSASSAIACKEDIREHYAAALGIEITLMSSMRRHAAANKRVARGHALSGNPLLARGRMLLAYVQGALSIFERRRRVGDAGEHGRMDNESH